MLILAMATPGPKTRRQSPLPSAPYFGEILPEENLPKTLVRTQGALLRYVGDDDGGGNGIDRAKHRDTRSYPGSGHYGGVKTYSCMSGIAPMEVNEELQVFGDLGMADPPYGALGCTYILWSWSSSPTTRWERLPQESK